MPCRSSSATPATVRGSRQPAALARSATASGAAGGRLSSRSSRRSRRRPSSPAARALASSKPWAAASASWSRQTKMASPRSYRVCGVRPSGSAISVSRRQQTRAPSRMAVCSGSRLRPSAASPLPIMRNGSGSKGAPGFSMRSRKPSMASSTAIFTTLT
ncbi:hypothetical protein [Nonomuraea sp. NPDC049758]|uniref:hypothetical protein n=1 Tax=Nonomuraea sp. NPDC049758 TaxID=3154360 RepID=UPI0034183150